MWMFLGSWIFVFLLVAAAGAGLFALCRRKARVTAAVTAAAFLVATGVLVSFLVAPTTVDGGVVCGGTVGSTHAEPLDGMTADDLAAEGAKDYSEDCLDAARERFALIVGGYVVVLAGIAAVVATRGSSRERRSVSV
ncbi:hypothetical protein [Nocardioides luteus]|uniref:Uncharacterized protein n=1 Tax=Nocardioides luteus TaxID=1844 RepID=A0A1J4N4W4_9ACTN|nr:hypothetical protein [Nocardioides luteus]OIJ26007.1 hypothetical protein UG56_014500 [Nocardioides luteus]